MRGLWWGNLRGDRWVKMRKITKWGKCLICPPSLAFLLISLLLVVKLTAEKDNMISGLPDLHHMDGLRNALDSGETQLHLNLWFVNASNNIVDRPTQLICISDIYLLSWWWQPQSTTRLGPGPYLVVRKKTSFLEGFSLFFALFSAVSWTKCIRITLFAKNNRSICPFLAVGTPIAKVRRL